MSVLYLAVHPETQEPIVVKVLLPKYCKNKETARKITNLFNFYKEDDTYKIITGGYTSIKKAIKELLDNSLNLVKITKRDLHTMYEEVEIEVELRVLPPKKD